MAKYEYVFGRHPVRELLASRPGDARCVYVAEGKDKHLEIVKLAKQVRVEVVAVPQRKLRDLVGPVTHQGVAAAVKPFEYADLDDIIQASTKDPEWPGLVVVLDQIQDPHNLGAIIRSSWGFGAHGVVIPKDRASEVTPVAVKSAAGAASRLPVARETNIRQALEALKKAGFWVYGTSLAQSGPLRSVDMKRAIALVIGSEGKGLRRLVAETCDELVQIPMRTELDSLNASVAAGVALYEVSRQRESA